MTLASLEKISPISMEIEGRSNIPRSAVTMLKLDRYD